jgi:hypothetical protein
VASINKEESPEGFGEYWREETSVKTISKTKRMLGAKLLARLEKISTEDIKTQMGKSKRQH